MYHGEAPKCEVDRIMAATDTDGDHKISFDEFMALMKVEMKPKRRERKRQEREAKAKAEAAATAGSAASVTPSAPVAVAPP